MQKIFVIILLATTAACSSYGNNPAPEFAHVQIEAGYYERMQAESCKVKKSYCTPYPVSSY